MAVRSLLLLLSILTVLCGVLYYGWQGMTAAAPQQTAAVNYTIAAVPPDAPKISIMFVGNSYTFVNDLPLMLRAIAADAQNPEDIETGEAVRGGARLVDTWTDSTAQALLTSRHWNYVVLQEQSLMAMQPQDQAAARAGFLAWGQAASAAGAMPVVYETWARQHGAADDSGPAMQAQIDYVLGAAAGTINATIVPAGDAWMRCAALPAAPLLYAADGSHPSLAGTYLTAMLFYRILTGHSPAESHFVPPGLDPAAAQVLRGCAS
jgi:hypothetical protein